MVFSLVSFKQFSHNSTNFATLSAFFSDYCPSYPLATPLWLRRPPRYQCLKPFNFNISFNCQPKNGDSPVNKATGSLCQSCFIHSLQCISQTQWNLRQGVYQFSKELLVAIASYHTYIYMYINTLISHINKKSPWQQWNMKKKQDFLVKSLILLPPEGPPELLAGRRGASMRIENLRRSYVYPRAVEIQRCIVSSYFFVIVSDVIINMDRSMNVDVYVHTYYAYIYILIEYVVYIYISIMG